MAISVSLGVIPENPPIAALCSPLLHGNLSQGLIFKIPPIAAHCSSLLDGIFSQGVIHWKSSHCSPLLQDCFSEGVIAQKSSHCSPLQPTLIRQLQSGDNSCKVLPLQPIAAHSYVTISVTLGKIPENPPIAAHCSSVLDGTFSQGVIPEKSSHCNPLQPTLTWQFQSTWL